MVYGEVGKSPLRNTINTRIINFWNRIKSGKQTKLSFVLLRLTKMVNDDITNSFESPWLCNVRSILDNCGLSYIWRNDLSSNNNKILIKCHYDDINKQQWASEIHNNSCCVNYRIFKENLVFEKYLTQLDFKYRIILCRFRCGNNRLPSNSRRFINDNPDMLCNLCNSNSIGDEFHYLFICDAFQSIRPLYLKKYYICNPNTYKMAQLFKVSSIPSLKKLCKFISIIVKKLS